MLWNAKISARMAGAIGAMGTEHRAFTVRSETRDGAVMAAIKEGHADGLEHVTVYSLEESTTALDLLPDYVRAEIAAANNPTPGTFSKPGLREDLRAIPSAEAAGWKVTFRNDSWHNGASFDRNGVGVWWSGCWRAKNDGAPFKEAPRLYSTLAEALAAEGGDHVG